MGKRKRLRRVRSPASTEARETKPANRATSDRGKRFTLSLGELSALTATIGALSYLLGLFVFALPIRRVYSIDMSTAWYATSLVPKTVVAGQGVTGMLGLPLRFAVYFVVAVALIDLARSNYRSVGTLWHKQKTKENLFLVIWALCPAVLFVWSWFETGSFLRSAINMIVFLLAALFLLSGQFRQYNLRLEFRYLAPKTRIVILPMFIIFLLGQFAQQAVRVAQEADPPLPRIEIAWTTEASDSTKATHTQGKLLTHTEGFWYVLNQGGQDVGLTAIPDDKVQHVRIGGQRVNRPSR